MFYYATRDDKDGNRLMTSYGNEASQKKYGGPEAKLHKGIVVRSQDSNEFAETDANKYDFESEDLIRSRIHCPQPTGAIGKFKIQYLNDSNWKDTDFRTNSYGTANTIMKALAPIYGDLCVVEETEVVTGTPSRSAGF